MNPQEPPRTPPAGLRSGEAAEIIRKLQELPDRQIYRTDNNEYFITYQGGGPFSGAIVYQMVTEGILVKKYFDLHGLYVLPPPNPSGPSAGVG